MFSHCFWLCHSARPRSLLLAHVWIDIFMKNFVWMLSVCRCCCCCCCCRCRCRCCCCWWCVQLLCARVFVVCDSFWRFQFRFVFSFPFLVHSLSLFLLPYLCPFAIVVHARSCSMWIDTFVFTAPFGICALQFELFFFFLFVLYETVSFFFTYIYISIYIFIRFFPLCERLRSLFAYRLYYFFFLFFSVFLFWLSGWIRIQIVWLYMRMYNSVVYLCCDVKFQ